jgi:GNAT superfamily N-acetyltransferase
MTTSPQDLDIAPARREDVPLVLALIRELAQFERLLDQVVATEAGLREALFGEPRRAEVLIARVGGEPVAFALYFYSFSTFLGRAGLYLEDLYVRSSYRGRGVGEALLRHLARLALDRGCGRFEWAVLDWNQRAIDFYRRLGAEPLGDWTTFRLAGDALARLAASGSPP